MLNRKLVAVFVGVAITGTGFAFVARAPESTRAAGVATNDPTARQATGWVTAFWRQEDFDRLTPEKQARFLANDPPPIGKEAIDAEAEYMRTTTDGRPADFAPEVEPPQPGIYEQPDILSRLSYDGKRFAASNTLVITDGKTVTDVTAAALGTVDPSTGSLDWKSSTGAVVVRNFSDAQELNLVSTKVTIVPGTHYVMIDGKEGGSALGDNGAVPLLSDAPGAAWQFTIAGGTVVGTSP